MPADTDFDREFADLAELIREDRIEIDPFFARELDARVAAGFPRERRRWLTFEGLRIPALVMVPLLALAIGLASMQNSADDAGLTSAGGGEAAESAGSASAPEAVQDAVGAAGGSGELQMSPRRAKKPSSGSVSPASSVATPPVPGGGSPAADRRQARKVETSASLALITAPAKLESVNNEIIAITERHRGFVVTSSLDLVEDGGAASYQLRIPSDRLKAAIADLSRIATVSERRETAQDITREHVSATDRLDEARADRRGLLRRLERAASEDERDRIRAQLRSVSARIAAAKADLARVNNRASFSTLAVTLTADPDATGSGVDDDGTWSPGDAARDALRVLEVAAGVLLIALAIGLPLALLAGLTLAVVRLTSRRRRERLLDAI